jgi:hypothetical protein
MRRMASKGSSAGLRGTRQTARMQIPELPSKRHRGPERVRVVVRENKINRLNSAKSEAICVLITNFSNKRHPAINSTD